MTVEFSYWSSKYYPSSEFNREKHWFLFQYSAFLSCSAPVSKVLLLLSPCFLYTCSRIKESSLCTSLVSAVSGTVLSVPYEDVVFAVYYIQFIIFYEFQFNFLEALHFFWVTDTFHFYSDTLVYCATAPRWAPYFYVLVSGFVCVVCDEHLHKKLCVRVCAFVWSFVFQ